MTRYTRTAMLFHWSIALLILGNLFLGLRLEGLKGASQFAAFQLHKSIGISILLLTLGRIAWRLTHRPPPLLETLSPLERTAANVVHKSFYALMLAMPLTGWAIVSASKYNIPTLLFGALSWPHIAPIHNASSATRSQVDAVAGTTHETLAWLMIALVALHVAGALKHQLFDRDGALLRMLPGSAKETANG